MAHPHRSDAKHTKQQAIDRLNLPDAGGLSGEGRLQKMKLHEEQGGNEPDEPRGSEDDDAAADAAEGEQE